ncbi:MAG: hypothetical protein HXY43_08155 [Fischerella sp.]|jgi:hypothetical protein|nr:hypothetical protein [Fischerella sp.]
MVLPKRAPFLEVYQDLLAWYSIAQIRNELNLERLCVPPRLLRAPLR